MLKKASFFSILLILIPFFAFAETIDVNIKGVDDGVKTTKQQDYKEAVLFAKREAIERAGVKVKALTTAKDFVVQSDYIESQAEAVLLPGYNIIDMGYSADGTYQIVLIGKVKTVAKKAEGIDSKELRYAKSLMERGQRTKAKNIINNIINNSKDYNTVAEAMYCQVLWKFAKDERDTFEKLKAYYPDSKYVRRTETIVIEREKEKERRRLEAERKKQRQLEAERKKQRQLEAERRRKREERDVKDSVQKSGDIYLESDPSEAIVYLDGVQKGRTPLELNKVPAGIHRIDLSKNKEFFGSLEIELKPDDFVKKKVSLIQGKGKIKISSEPSGAKIYLDEKDTGKTTPDIIETVVGEHELKLEKETDKGRFKHKRKILIAHNRVLPLHIKDFEMPERAKIITDPLGARIYLDEKDTGKVTPDVVYIEAGEHDLKLIKTTGKGNYVYKSKIISVSNRKITLRITDFETPASRHEKTKKKLVVDIQRVIDDGRLNRVTGIKLRTIFVLNNFNDANRYDKLDAAITKCGDTKGRVKVTLEKESLVYYIDGKRVNKVIDIPINIEDLEKENLETFKKKTIDIIADEVLRKKGF